MTISEGLCKNKLKQFGISDYIIYLLSFFTIILLIFTYFRSRQLNAFQNLPTYSTNLLIKNSSKSETLNNLNNINYNISTLNDITVTNLNKKNINLNIFPFKKIIISIEKALKPFEFAFNDHKLNNLENLSKNISRKNIYFVEIVDKLNFQKIKSKVKIRKYFYYKIKNGDTLGKIAKRFNIKLKSILNNNKIKNPDLIFQGKIINIPHFKSKVKKYELR